jgi:hypothetical protein
MKKTFEIKKCYAIVYCNEVVDITPSFKYAIIGEYFDGVHVLIEESHFGVDLIYPFFQIMQGDKQIIKHITAKHATIFLSFAKLRDLYKENITLYETDDISPTDLSELCNQLITIEDLTKKSNKLNSIADIFKYSLRF